MHTTINDVKYSYNGLTRGQLKSLDVSMDEIARITDLEEQGTLLEVVFDYAKVKPAPELDDMTPGQALDLFYGVLETTYTPEYVRKNLQTPPANGSPDGDMTAGNAGEQKDCKNGDDAGN